MHVADKEAERVDLSQSSHKPARRNSCCSRLTGTRRECLFPGRRDLRVAYNAYKGYIRRNEISPHYSDNIKNMEIFKRKETSDMYDAILFHYHACQI